MAQTFDDLPRLPDGRINTAELQSFIEQLRAEKATTTRRPSKLDKYKAEIITLVKGGAKLDEVCFYLRKRKLETRTSTLKKYLERQASLDKELESKLNLLSESTRKRNVKQHAETTTSSDDKPI